MFSALRMMMSLSRPVMRTLPSVVDEPRSPVRNQPSLVERVGVERCVDVAEEALRALRSAQLALLADRARRRRRRRPLGPHARRPARPTVWSSTSIGVVRRAEVAIGNSVSPQEPTSVDAERRSRISSWISAGTGAPPNAPARRSGNSGVVAVAALRVEVTRGRTGPRCRAASDRARPCARASSPGRTCRTARAGRPPCSARGEHRRRRRCGRSARRSDRRRSARSARRLQRADVAARITVRSVWRTPFGSAVVPDE